MEAGRGVPALPHILHGDSYGGIRAAVVHYEHLVGESRALLIPPPLQVPAHTPRGGPSTSRQRCAQLLAPDGAALGVPGRRGRTAGSRPSSPAAAPPRCKRVQQLRATLLPPRRPTARAPAGPVRARSWLPCQSAVSVRLRTGGAPSRETPGSPAAALSCAWPPPCLAAQTTRAHTAAHTARLSPVAPEVVRSAAACKCDVYQEELVRGAHYLHAGYVSTSR